MMHSSMRAGSDADRIRKGRPASEGTRLNDELLLGRSSSKRIPAVPTEVLDDADDADILLQVLLLLSGHAKMKRKEQLVNKDQEQRI